MRTLDHKALQVLIGYLFDSMCSFIIVLCVLERSLECGCDCCVYLIEIKFVNDNEVNISFWARIKKPFAY